MSNRHEAVRICAVLLLVVLAGLSVWGASRPQRGEVLHDFSFPCDAQSFFAQDAGKPEAYVSSRDKQKQVVMEDVDAFRVFVNRHSIDTVKYSDIRDTVYVGWSPDSTEFFIMYSDGDWHVHIFTVDEERIHELPAPQIAFEDFKKKHSCKTRDNRILFLSWTPDSQKVFLVTEVHPTSDCGDEAARFQGYLMKARTGEILRRYNEKETTKIERDCRATKTLKLSD
jgi:hypothetical protein